MYLGKTTELVLPKNLLLSFFSFLLILFFIFLSQFNHENINKKKFLE